MKCQEFWDSLPQRGGNISGEQSDHLAECASCGAEWEPHRMLTANLQSLSEDWRKLEALPRVEAGLTAAFRAQTGYQVQRSLRHSWWTPVIAWASAAAAMIALAAVMVRGYQPAASTPNVAAPHRAVQQLVQTASLTTVDGESADDASILGEGFVHIPNQPPVQPDEDFGFVRAEVPASAMIEMGVPVSEDRAADTIVAEFAMGPDGRARAVRVVSGGGTF